MERQVDSPVLASPFRIIFLSFSIVSYKNVKGARNLNGRGISEIDRIVF